MDHIITIFIFIFVKNTQLTLQLITITVNISQNLQQVIVYSFINIFGLRNCLTFRKVYEEYQYCSVLIAVAKLLKVSITIASTKYYKFSN